MVQHSDRPWRPGNQPPGPPDEDRASESPRSESSSEAPDLSESDVEFLQEIGIDPEESDPSKNGE
jgi:hypothetical protein